MQRASFCSLFVAKLFYQRFSAFSFPRVTYVSYLNIYNIIATAPQLMEAMALLLE